MSHDVLKKKITEWVEVSKDPPFKAFQNRLLWRYGGGVGVKFVSSWRCQILFPFPGNLVGTESSGSKEIQ